MVQTAINDLEGFIIGMDPWKLFGQPGVPAQFSPDQDTESLLFFLKSPGRAGGDALAAGKASGKVKNRSPFLQGDRPLATDLHAGPALAAGLGRDFWPSGADDSQVRDLRPGAGVGTVGYRYPKFMMHLQRPVRLSLEKGFQVSSRETFFQCMGEIVIMHSPVGASAGPKAGLYLVAFYFVFHPIQKAPLAGSYMFQTHLVCLAAGGFFLDPFPHPLANEERDFGYGRIGLFGPFHKFSNLPQSSPRAQRKEYR